MTKKILVTSGSGWLGSAIVRSLLDRGDAVIATDVVGSSAALALPKQNIRLTIIPADMGEWSEVFRIFQEHKPAAVIHTGSIVGVVQAHDIPIKALRVTVEGSINLFEWMRLSGVKRVVHISTEETYGDFRFDLVDEEHPQNPTSVYDMTKLAVEHLGRIYSRDHGLECNVRTCWGYGPYLPRLRVQRTFIEAALRGEVLHQDDGGEFAVGQVYIDDTVAGVLLALDKAKHRYDGYFISTDVASTIRQTAEAVNQAVPGSKVTIGDNGPYRHGARVLSARKGAMDISRARKEFRYEPKFTLQRGIEATIAITKQEVAKTK